MDFVFVASSWLRFLGRLVEPAQGPFAQHLNEFLKYIKEERGFAEASALDNRRRSPDSLLDWLSRRNGSLAAINPQTSPPTLSLSDRTWKRTTISFHVQSLRAFFRFAGLRRSCQENIAKTIEAPRLYTYENLPQGPSWRRCPETRRKPAWKKFSPDSESGSRFSSLFMVSESARFAGYV